MVGILNMTNFAFFFKSQFWAIAKYWKIAFFLCFKDGKLALSFWIPFSGCLPLECTSPLKTPAAIGYTVQLGRKTINRDQTRNLVVSNKFQFGKMMEFRVFFLFADVFAVAGGCATVRCPQLPTSNLPWRSARGKSTTGCQIALEWLPNVQMDTMAKPRHDFCNKNWSGWWKNFSWVVLGDHCCWSTYFCDLWAGKDV